MVKGRCKNEAKGKKQAWYSTADTYTLFYYIVACANFGVCNSLIWFR